MSDTNRWKTPWSVSTERLTCIRDCDGNYVVINVDLATAALIVEAVNERRRNIDRIEQLRAACLAAIDRMTKTRDGLIDYIHTWVVSGEQLENGEKQLDAYGSVIAQLTAAVQGCQEPDSEGKMP